MTSSLWIRACRLSPLCFPPLPPLQAQPLKLAGGLLKGSLGPGTNTPDQVTLVALLPWLTGVLYLASALLQVPESLLGEPTESWALDSYQSRLPATLAFQLQMQMFAPCRSLMTDSIL